MLGTVVTNVFFLIHFPLLLSALQVRKELEMSGIEFYPQKEFDDDMEDKSDNDKIRVCRFFVSRDICGAIFFLGIRMNL